MTKTLTQAKKPLKACKYMKTSKYVDQPKKCKNTTTCHVLAHSASETIYRCNPKNDHDGHGPYLFIGMATLPGSYSCPYPFLSVPIDGPALVPGTHPEGFRTGDRIQQHIRKHHRPRRSQPPHRKCSIPGGPGASEIPVTGRPVLPFRTLLKG